MSKILEIYIIILFMKFRQYNIYCVKIKIKKIKSKFCYVCTFFNFVPLFLQYIRIYRYNLLISMILKF